MNIGICGHFLGAGGKGRFSKNLTVRLEDTEYMKTYLINPQINVEKNMKNIYIGNECGSTLAKAATQYIDVEKLNNVDLDIIHCPGEIVPPYFWKVDAKKVITFGGDGLVCNLPLIDRIKLYQGAINLRHILSLSSIRLLGKRVDKFTTVSKMMVDNIAQAYKIDDRKIKPIHHGYNPSVFYKMSDDQITSTLINYNISEPYIIHISSFRKIKNTKRIIKAFEKMSSLNNMVPSLVFVGPKNNRYKQVQELANKSNMSNSIRFLGRVTGKDLTALYSGAEVLCQPSYRETFSFPILESLACGTPVITSKNVGILEDRPHSQLRVNPEKTDEICAKMKIIVGNSELQREYVNNVKDLVEEHRWSNIIPKYVDMYKSIVY